MFTRIKAFFMSVVLMITSAFPCLFGGTNTNPAADTQIMPETWAAVDGLGRTLPCAGEVREADDSKFVAMFYWTWHTDHAKNLTAKNVTDILAQHPEILHDFDSPLWEAESSYPDGRPFYWNEPIWGYYTDLDAYVVRKNAELLADAGVDVIVFDCTNGTLTWDSSCMKLFEVFEQAKQDGVRVPKIAYMLPFSASEDANISLKHLYNDIYAPGLYRDLWFYWDGKPLIMAHSDALNKRDKQEKEILDFFTFRKNDPSYFSKSTSYGKKTWGWCSDYPQTCYGKSLNGRVEEICVSVAQNAADGRLVAQNADENVQGRSFTHGDFSYKYNYAGRTVTVDKTIENADFYGLNFQQQREYSLKLDPDMIFVDGWNEWLVGRWKEWMGCKNAFPDQFSDEHSRDIEPSSRRLKDHYYYQLVANIRRFKGISAQTIEHNGVKIYYHYTNSTLPRDIESWIGTRYTSDTMRNDFVRADVCDDGEFINLTVTTKDPITPYTDPAWMRVWIDTDPTGVSDNWEGFEYCVNRANATEDTLTVERVAGGRSFVQTGTASYTVHGNQMQIRIPAVALGMQSEAIHFNFKLADNTQDDDDILDFYKSGDVAPGGRFTFVY